MLKQFFALAILTVAGVAVAQAACNDQLVTVDQWSITPKDADTNEMTVTFRSNAAHPIRMIDGQAGYRDALGDTIAAFEIDRDVDVAPGGTFSTTGLWGPNTFERLLVLKHDEVTAYTCIKAVLYDDGTVEKFP